LQNAGYLSTTINARLQVESHVIVILATFCRYISYSYTVQLAYVYNTQDNAHRDPPRGTSPSVQRFTTSNRHIFVGRPAYTQMASRYCV